MKLSVFEKLGEKHRTKCAAKFHSGNGCMYGLRRLAVSQSRLVYFHNFKIKTNSSCPICSFENFTFE